MEAIKQKWQNAAKVYGLSDVLTLANGETITGYYVMAEAGSCTPSHDVRNGFSMSAGFPTDQNGNSTNDRDYERDKDAQEITRNIARNYDNRALQTPVVVSPDGVVLSGNGRTMAGELAAQYNTDAAYIEYISEYGGKFGFSALNVAQFEHPRILFVINYNLPYTATTFAKFNAQDMKGQNKTEQAIKFGKMIDDATFSRIIASINAFETLGDFYANTEAATRCLNELRNCGVVDGMQYAAMFDGDTISAQGKETLENVLIGKAFATNPDAARHITKYKSLRKSVVFALAEISNNLQFGEDYRLEKELTEATELAYNAREAGYRAGERVSGFARQTTMFEENATVADYSNSIILTIADILNDNKATLLRKMLSVYNHQAKDSADGQMDIFSGGIKTKAEILEDVKAIFATASAREQNEAVNEAVEARIIDTLLSTEETTEEQAEEPEITIEYVEDYPPIHFNFAKVGLYVWAFLLATLKFGFWPLIYTLLFAGLIGIVVGVSTINANNH